MGKSKYMN